MDSLGTGFDALLTRGALAALALAAGWAVAIVLAVALEALTEGRVDLAAGFGCPTVLRAWLLGAMAGVLAAGPAHADTGWHVAPPPGAHSDGRVAAALDGLPLPDRQSATVRAPSVVARIAVVREGDTLWQIARRQLPRGAGEGGVATTVAALYAANRRVIGPDPDLIRPGQRLVVGHHHVHPRPHPEER